MLRIYWVCLELLRVLRPYCEKIGRFDRDLAGQLKRSSSAIALNIAEGSGSRAGRRRHCYDVALGEARETLAALEVACAIGYLSGIEPDVRSRFDQVIGTLVNLVR